MPRKDCLTLAKTTGVRDGFPIDKMIAERNKLVDGGMTAIEAEAKVISDYQQELNEELNALKRAVGVPVSKKKATSKKAIPKPEQKKEKTDTEVLLESIDEAIEAKGAEARELRSEIREAFGEKTYADAVKVTKEFEKIISQLEQQGKIKKICP